jgi:hypothetical protein
MSIAFIFGALEPGRHEVMLCRLALGLHYVWMELNHLLSVVHEVLPSSANHGTCGYIP